MAVAGATALPPAGAATVKSGHGQKNANFKGLWQMSNTQDFTITRENRHTGTCKGTTTLGDPYKLVACKVSRDHFTFHITYPGGFVADYTGKFAKHSLHGKWHDTNGSFGTYTATRQ